MNESAKARLFGYFMTLLDVDTKTESEVFDLYTEVSNSLDAKKHLDMVNEGFTEHMEKVKRHTEQITLESGKLRVMLEKLTLGEYQGSKECLKYLARFGVRTGVYKNGKPYIIMPSSHHQLINNGQ